MPDNLIDIARLFHNQGKTNYVCNAIALAGLQLRQDKLANTCKAEIVRLLEGNLDVEEYLTGQSITYRDIYDTSSTYCNLNLTPSDKAFMQYSAEMFRLWLFDHLDSFLEGK